MSTIVSQPDFISYSGNLKKFEISSSQEVTFVLQKMDAVILTEKYMPDADGLVTVNVAAIIDRLLDIGIPPDAQATTYIQEAAGAPFTATIDGNTPYLFIVMKGGVNELDIPVVEWLATHFLTWQPQEKYTLQTQPEWLGIMPMEYGYVGVRAYYADGTDYGYLYTAIEGGKITSINVSWGAISAWLIGRAQSGDAVAWDVSHVGGAVITQRYRLRNKRDDEHVYVWANTLGGIDSVSFTGACEQDYKLNHKTALFEGDTINEYDVEKPREFRQSTGYLERYEAEWIADFFYSRKKYMIRFDGAIKRIAVTGSKLVDTTQQDEVDYEFTYRLGEDLQLLNLDRVNAELPAPEGLDTFFLTELLSGLTVAQYTDNLVIAVQNPYSDLWQQLSVAQLWGGLLPSLVDGTTITYLNGKLTAVGGETIINNSTWTDITNYINNILNVNNADSSTRLISGSIILKGGLTFTASDLVYKILGVQYTASGRDITLPASDPNLPRLDIIYCDTNGNIQFAAGVPGANPATPTLGPTQFGLITVLIAAGATTPSDITTEIIYDENVEWDTSETHDPGSPNPVTSVSFESVHAPQSGGKCIDVSIDVPPMATSYSTHYIGEKFGGGVIFWLGPTGKSGLISSETDAVASIYWESLSGHSVYSTGGAGTAIGTGQANTAAMMASDAARDWAAAYCTNLILNGYDDWFMPSVFELQEMYKCRWNIGYFANKTYWSSSEDDWDLAWCVTFADGVNRSRKKNNNYSVRAIRAFDETMLPTTQPVLNYPPTDTSFTFIGPEPLTAMNGVLSFWLKSSKDWLQNSILVVDSYRGVVQTGRVTLTPASHMFGYTPGSGTWQQVILPMYYFAPTNPGVDRFTFTLAGSWPNDFDLYVDNIRFQHNTATPPEGVVFTSGTFGSDARQLQVTVNQDGKVTNVVEIAVPEWIDFTFADIATNTFPIYMLNLKARVPYLIESLSLTTLMGGTCECALIVFNEIEEHAVTGLDLMEPNDTIQEFTATALNTVYPGDMVVLFVTGVTGATTLVGQLNLRRL